tara:strand:+ start:178 stop:699 length:522 start_codon:yes stop_codon:yes gene_type:complete
MNIEQTLQLLNIQEVTTKKQKANGTREFKLPVRDQYGAAIHVASYKTGYVRRTKAGGYCPSWQLNKRVESEPKYYEILEWDSKADMNCKRTGKYRKYTTRTCKLIPNEQERLEYLISYCLKNYYIKQSNMLSSGEFIPKWKHEAYKDEYKNRVNEVNNPEVKVIVNGHRYNII